MDPESDAFLEDLRRFVSICRVVKGLRNARIGAIGARPTNFNTVRFSEKLFERSGISVETIDLSEIFGRAQRLKENDPKLQPKMDEMKSYVTTSKVPNGALVRMARLGSSD